MRIQVFRKDARYLRAPGDGVGTVLLFGRIRHDLVCRQRIGTKSEHFLGGGDGLVELLSFQPRSGALEQARLAPAIVGVGRIGKREEGENKSQNRGTAVDGEPAL